MNKKIIITGAAGFIGSQLAWQLHQAGHELILIDDLSFGYESNLVRDGKMPAELIKLDIRSPDLHAYVKDAYCLFHLAAISALPVNQIDPYRALSIGVAGTANVLEAARQGSVRRVVFASTSAVYENNAQFPCREDDAVSPMLVYSLGKAQAEQICASFAKTYGMDVVITRYYNAYGPHQDIRRKSPAFVGYVIRELLQGRAPILHSDGKQCRDYVYLDDINDLNIACMEHVTAPGNIFNVASGKGYSVNEIYGIIADIIGTTIKPQFRAANLFWDKYPELFTGAHPFNQATLQKEVDKFTLGSTEKAKNILGWTASTSIEDGLRRTIDYTRRLPEFS